MANLKTGLGLAALVIAGASQAAVTLVTTPAGLAANDSVNWAQLGTDGTVFGPGFTATSVGSLAISGSLSGGDACVTVVGGVNCGWTAATGFLPGDSVIWTESSTSYSGTGPLTLSFPAVLGAGAYVQATWPGAFTAFISAYNGATLLNTFTANSLTGDGIFIGVLDTVSDITKIQVGLTSCSAACDINDFAVNTLQLKVVSSVPEVPTAGLMLLGLLALPWTRRRLSAMPLVDQE